MADNNTISLLVIDDSAVTCKLLEQALTREGYKVFTSLTGVDGRKIATEMLPDIIILDIMMSGENGFEVIKKLKKNFITASIPIIFISGRDDISSKIKCFELGAVDYITKPFHMVEVIARIRLHLKLSLATNYLISSQTEKLSQIHAAQQSMLVSPKDLPKAQFGAWYQALLEAGGDFYDVFQISNEIFGYFVADISGHDIATSFITAAVKVLLKQNCLPIYSPQESMKMLNDVLTDVLPGSKYMTACYVKLNRKAKLFTLTNAGHLPVVFLPKNQNAYFVELPGDVIGMFKNVSYGSIDIKVKKGDRFFMFTDGLIETPKNRKIWTQGLEEIKTACEELRDIHILDAPKKLKEILMREDSVPEDDIVILGGEI